MKAPRASGGFLVYHNLDPDCHIGPASMRTLHASHVSNPVVISKEKAKSYPMRRSNSSPPTKVQSVTYYREHPKPPSPAFTSKRNYYVNASWHLIFLTPKFSYLLFCNPTHKTETPNWWETTNSRVILSTPGDALGRAC